LFLSRCARAKASPRVWVGCFVHAGLLLLGRARQFWHDSGGLICPAAATAGRGGS
jgi:hypothetical protein